MTWRVPGNRRATRWRRATTLLIAVTVLACVSALVFRAPLRLRYSAWRIVHGTGQAERAAYLSALCNAGDRGRWGTSALRAHRQPHMRQPGVVVLRHLRTDRTREWLLRALANPDQSTRNLAALDLPIRGDDSLIPKLKAMY